MSPAMNLNGCRLFSKIFDKIFSFNFFFLENFPDTSQEPHQLERDTDHLDPLSPSCAKVRASLNGMSVVISIALL